MEPRSNAVISAYDSKTLSEPVTKAEACLPGNGYQNIGKKLSGSANLTPSIPRPEA